MNLVKNIIGTIVYFILVLFGLTAMIALVHLAVNGLFYLIFIILVVLILWLSYNFNKDRPIFKNK